MNLINEGDKVGASEATLLNMLSISPFSYGLMIQTGRFLVYTIHTTFTTLFSILPTFKHIFPNIDYSLIKFFY